MKRQSISVGHASNRSALIRVPRATEPESTRLELRCPDPSCNPYLAFAVMLAAGLDGIRRELPVPDATEENIYLIENQRQMKASVLPGSLNQALNAIVEIKSFKMPWGHTPSITLSAPSDKNGRNTAWL